MSQITLFKSLLLAFGIILSFCPNLNEPLPHSKPFQKLSRMYRLIFRQISRRKYRLPPWFNSKNHQGHNTTEGSGHYIPPVALASAALFTSNSNDDISINEAIKVNDYRTVREIIQLGDKESSLKYNKVDFTSSVLSLDNKICIER